MSKKTKKAMSMLLVVTLIAVIAIGGMLAYLTDRDSEANVFTVGDVDITLEEPTFKQDSTLTPGVKIEKDPFVKNEGPNGAWVWTTVYVPKALDAYVALGEQDKTNWLWIEEDNETVDGIEYVVYTALHKEALAATETTSALFTSVTLNGCIDITPEGNWYAVEAGKTTELGWDNTKTPKILVNAYAMQVEQFNSVLEARDAFNAQWAMDGVKPVMVDNVDEFKAAAKTKGETIVLAPGTYNMGGNFSVAEGVSVVGDGNVVIEGTLTSTIKNIEVKNVTFKGNNAQRWAYAGGDVVFEDCTFEGTGVYAIHYDGTSGANILYKNCDIIGWVAIAGGHNSLTFDGCKISGNGNYGVIRTFGDATIKNCTFDVDNVNKTDVYQDGIHAVDCNIDVINCVNVNGTMEAIYNVSGTGTINGK